MVDRLIAALIVLAVAPNAQAQTTQPEPGVVADSNALGSLTVPIALRVTGAANAAEGAIASANALPPVATEMQAIADCLVDGDEGPWAFALRLRRNGAVRSASFVPRESQRETASPSAECIRGVLLVRRFHASLGRRIEVAVSRGQFGAGFGGLGLRGTGRGGGGTGEGTIGLGNLGTIGPGRGQRMTSRVRTGSAMVSGTLSREVIRRVIRRHINEVRYCYERELTSTPTLEGTLVMRFEISSTGAVTSAEGARVPDGFAAVAGCVKRAMLRWTFPAPLGGGIVRVNYPFAFHP